MSTRERPPGKSRPGNHGPRRRGPGGSDRAQRGDGQRVGRDDDRRPRSDGPPRGDRRPRSDGPPRGDRRPYGERGRGEGYGRPDRPRYREEPRTPPRAAALADIEEAEVEIEKLVAGGEGFGRIKGIPIFVPRSAPGDRLRVRLVERRADFGRAEILEVLEPGPDRREAPCPHFDRCGGCDLQHIDDGRQLALKAMATRETLERIGKVTLPDDVRVLAGDAWGYRLRAQLHTAATERGMAVGYHARGSRELVPVRHCPVLVPELESLLKRLPRYLRDDPRPRLDVAVGDDGALSTAPVIADLPHGPIALTVGEHTYRFDARCFFQAHRGLLGALVEQAVGSFEGETAFDLFAGVGLFTLPLALRYKRVVAVEGERIAARYARVNARTVADRARVSVENTSVEHWIAQLPAGADRVVVDPPRSGLPRPVVAALLAKRPKRVTYVSCHAATLARDLRQLLRGYSLASLALIDLFPQTGHLEAIVQLVAERPPQGDTEDATQGDAQGDTEGGTHA